MKPAPFVLAFLPLAVLPGHSATVEITVRDARDAAIEDAVVWVMPKSAAAPVRGRDAAIEQMNKQFVPKVSVVQAGTLVRFPNRDPIRHHVYSFSPAKIFEIKLYAGTQATPIVFDKPGEVVLGCNIHDNMVGYVYVVETPWFARTGKDGRARIEGLPGGEYDLHLWHFAQAASEPARAISLRGDENQAFLFAMPLRMAVPRPSPK